MANALVSTKDPLELSFSVVADDPLSGFGPNGGNFFLSVLFIIEGGGFPLGRNLTDHHSFGVVIGLDAGARNFPAENSAPKEQGPAAGFEDHRFLNLSVLVELDVLDESPVGQADMVNLALPVEDPVPFFERHGNQTLLVVRHTLREFDRFGARKIFVLPSFRKILGVVDQEINLCFIPGSVGHGPLKVIDARGKGEGLGFFDAILLITQGVTGPGRKNGARENRFRRRSVQNNRICNLNGVAGTVFEFQGNGVFSLCAFKGKGFGGCKRLPFAPVLPAVLGETDP